jgi:uncharacterized membrane protein YkoI
VKPVLAVTWRGDLFNSMKKTYLRVAIASLGLSLGSNLVTAQTASGGAAAGGTAAGGATSSGAASGAAAGRAAPSGTLNTVGGSSVIQANPNNAASDLSRGGVPANPPVNPAATPAGAAPAAAPVQLNTLPATVRNTLQGFSANGSLGSVTPVPGQAGTFRASVVQNGVPTELTIAPNGRIISQAPITGSPASTTTAGTAANAGVANLQAGIPLTSLPPAVANSIQSQLGGAQVQSISRDDLANGTVFRVTTTQNGVPTEMRFAANGTLLGATPLTGTATSALAPGSTVVPGGALVMDQLPNTVQDAVRAQLGAIEASRIMQQRGTNGVNYVVSYMQDGRPMVMVVGPDGRVLRNGPAGASASVAANATSSTATATTEATKRTTIKLDELPDDVENALKQKAPYAEVRTITQEQRVGGDVYVIAVRDGDRAGEIEIDANGKVLRDTRRDLSALTPLTPVRVPEEKQEGIPYDQVPVAIQNAIKAYATASDIRSIQLGLDRDGKTVFDVIFYRDGRRDRMIITKTGRLVRIEEDVSPALELASNKAPVLAVGDLSPKVQETIRRQTDKVVVKDIQTKEIGGETVYQVSFTNTNGTPTELLVSQSGEVILPQGDRGNERAGAPLTADVDKDEPDPVRVVDATNPRPNLNLDAAGAAAVSERSNGAGSISTPSATAPERAVAEVKLSDTPQPVQDTIKTMSGSGSVERVTPRLGDSGITYEVHFMEGGKPRTVILDRNGVVQNQKEASAP